MSTDGCQTMLELNKIHKMDALNIPWDLPDEFIDCIVTSPPYWGLRDYGVEGQLGLEKTFQEYISKLCDIFDEVKRVLKNTGTCWVNLGDTYGGSWGNYGERNGRQREKKTEMFERKGATPKEIAPPMRLLQGKCLIQIPHRFAIEMCNRGWILRNTIIWHKPNCMPSSVKDRFTVDFEYMFFFVKSKKYYFEQQYEQWVQRKHDIERAENNHQGYNGKYREGYNAGSRDILPGQGIKGQPVGNPQVGRNKRTVWRINTQPFPEAHFAVFPPELVETPIKAGCPKEVCKKCGKPREKIYSSKSNYEKRERAHAPFSEGTKVDSTGWKPPDIRFEGYKDCGCGAGFEPGIVLDPFIGAGTTALVARQLSRQFIGFDLKAEYVEMAWKRVEPHMNQRKITEEYGEG